MFCVLRSNKVLCRERGVQSFKMFLAYQNVFQLPDIHLIDVFKHCKKLGAITQVHAENGDLVAEGCFYLFVYLFVVALLSF